MALQLPGIFGAKEALSVEEDWRQRRANTNGYSPAADRFLLGHVRVL